MGWWTRLNNWIDDTIYTPNELADDLKDEADAARKALFNFLILVVFIGIIAWVLISNK